MVSYKDGAGLPPQGRTVRAGAALPPGGARLFLRACGESRFLWLLSLICRCSCCSCACSAGVTGRTRTFRAPLRSLIRPDPAEPARRGRAASAPGEVRPGPAAVLAPGRLNGNGPGIALGPHRRWADLSVIDRTLDGPATLSDGGTRGQDRVE